MPRAKELEKRKEIINTFNKNYLLEAGAGAGKTSIIVDRIINHIISVDMNPSNIVAITFTKAASMELAERIQLKALECIKNEKNPEIIKRLNNVDKIFTGTIHSFCEIIIREMPFEAGMTPNYEIIEDDIKFHNEIWYRFLRDRENEYKKIIDLLKDVNIDYRELRSKVITALENPDVRFMGYDDMDYSLEDLKLEFNRIMEKYHGLSHEGFKNNSNLSKFFRSMLVEDKDLTKYIEVLLREFAKEEFQLEIMFEKLVLKKYLDELRYKELISEIFNVYDGLNKLIYNYCTDFINMVVDYRKENFIGKVTFNELLYRASSVVKNSLEGREHFKNKYRYFYIDEMQDTDPMQAELIFYLIHQGEEIKSWKDCKPKAGSLFVVGDPKQSIYRFRRADISIYNKVKEIISSHGEVVNLDINFRSSHHICSWVEENFRYNEEIDFGFREDSTEEQAGFKGILSMWEEEGEDALSGVYGYYTEEKEEDYIAFMVEEILSSHHIYKKHRDRVVEGDIMILTKSNEETGRYLKALKDRGISAVLSGEKSLGDSREVMNLFFLIDALVNHGDNVKLVAALRNSFYLDLETIELVLEDYRDLSNLIFSMERIERIQHRSMKNALIYFNEILRKSNMLSPIVLIESLVEERVGIYDVKREYSKLETRDAESALRQTIEILKSKVSNLYELRQELEKLISSRVGYELPMDKHESENAVRIMNIHKAKGLESNIVILVGLNKKRNIFSTSHYIETIDDKNMGFMSYGRLNILCSHEQKRKARERLFMEKEVDRLLYVAGTRPKSVLIIADSGDEKGFLYPLSLGIKKQFSLEKREEHRDIILELDKEKDRELEITRDLRILREISKPSYIKVSPSQFSQVKEDNRGIAGNYISPKIKCVEGTRVSSSEPRGKVYGNIIHSALENLIKKSHNLKEIDQSIMEYSIRIGIDRNIDGLEINRENIRPLYGFDSKSMEDVLQFAMDNGNMEGKERIKKRLYGYVEKVLNDFIENQSIREIFQDAIGVYPELPFTICLDGNDEIYDKILDLLPRNKYIKNKQMLIKGTMDLVVETNDGYIILDYKTDYHGSLNKYIPQLEGYRILFEEITKCKVDDVLFYSTAKGDLIDAKGRG